MDSRPKSWGAMASRLVQHIRSLRGGAPPPTLRTKDEAGQGLAEYALILALIAIVAVGAVAFVGDSIVGTLTDPVNRVFHEVVDLIA